MKDETNNIQLKTIKNNEYIEKENIFNVNKFNKNNTNINNTSKINIKFDKFKDINRISCYMKDYTRKNKISKKIEYNNNSLKTETIHNKINENLLKRENISMIELNNIAKNEEEYIDEILKNLFEEERNQQNLNPNYFKYQSDINPYMRSILIDWIINVNIKFSFKEETLYIAIYIIDAFLSKQYIEKRYFQLLGLSSLLIASKLNEIKLRRISDYSIITDNIYDIQIIKKMEYYILKTLNFNLLFPTPLSFYEIISQKIGISNDINKYKFGEFLMQSFLINNISLYYSQSTIACASCYIILKFCKMNNYKTIFELKNFYMKNSLLNDNNNNCEYLIKDCAKKICETVNIIMNSNLKSTINKYSDNYYYNIIKNN